MLEPAGPPPMIATSMSGLLLGIESLLAVDRRSTCLVSASRLSRIVPRRARRREAVGSVSHVAWCAPPTVRSVSRQAPAGMGRRKYPRAASLTPATVGAPGRPRRHDAAARSTDRARGSRLRVALVAAAGQRTRRGAHGQRVTPPARASAE